MPRPDNVVVRSARSQPVPPRARRCAAALIALGLIMAMAPAARAAVTGRAVKVMALGDSITYGVGSSTSSSYRAALWNRLVGGAGLSIDFVGSQQSGALPDSDNEGHPGWRIEQITASIDGWIASTQPDVVLLHIGTNDMAQNFDVANAPARLGELIDRIVADDPAVVVLVAAIVPATDATVDARIAAFNAAVPGVVSARSAHARYVDLNSTITAADMNDSLHPNDIGYDKMASLWFSALEAVLASGRDWPLFSTGLDAAEPQPTWTDTVDFSANVGGFNANLVQMESGVRAEWPRGGLGSLMYSGNDLSASQSFSYNRVFDVDIRLSATSVLSYWIYPQSTNGSFVAIDFIFTDGSNLRDSGAVDQYGVRAHPQLQGEGGHLVVTPWNLVKVNVGGLAGKTIDRIDIGYDQPASTGPYRGYVDDIAIVDSVRQQASAAALVNVALKRPVTGDAPCAAGETPDRLVDGTSGNNSKWCSGVGGAQASVDLGAIQPVRTVVVRHASAGGEPAVWNTRAFRISTSTDNATWQSFATVTGNVDGVTTSTVTAPRLVRYVRFAADAPAQDGSAATRIYEISVYGD